MQSQNEYIGDDNFKKFLEHYGCLVPIEVVKMRFAGAICSPNHDLRPTDVISSFWPEGQSPRLETKNEAELFFKFFMGLWDQIFEDIRFNKLTLPLLKKDQFTNQASLRYAQIEYGFLEGFWAGSETLKIPAYLTEVIDSLSRLADVYQILIDRAEKGEKETVLLQTMKDTDKMVLKTISFVIENFLKPKMDSYKENIIC